MESLYYPRKIWYAAMLFVLSGLFRLRKGAGTYYGKLSGFAFGRKAVFAFWNPVLVHLGDQLFHQPLVEAFLEKGYEVTVCAPPALAPYWEALGARCVPFAALKNERPRGAIFISKHDMAFDVWRHFGRGNAFVGLNYDAFAGGERIIPAIFREVAEACRALGAADEFSGGAMPAPHVPSALATPPPGAEWPEYFRKHAAQKFIAFNNYVASGYRGIRGRARLLEEMACRRIREGYSLVHVGSDREKVRDRRRYAFIDLDLRGKLEPMELFSLLSLPNVKGAVSFDTFVAHAASLCRKDLYVVSRDVRRKNKIRERFIPMYPDMEGLVREFE